MTLFRDFLCLIHQFISKNSAIWFNNAASQSISTQSLLGLQDNSGVALWFPPNNHSQGIGTQLLQKSLEEIDALHEAAYLESSNPRNMSLYERHGFEVVKKFQFGDGPPIHTMLREAR